MKVTKYTIDWKIDETKCIVCGKKIKVGEVSYEFRPDGGPMAPVTKEQVSMVWCKTCLPKGSKVYKGTQLY